LANWSSIIATRPHCRRPTCRADREKADIAILDARRFDEYATMSIPGGSARRVPSWCCAPAPGARSRHPIIVNCAGRTRSIIGTQSLINAGLPNRIYALRNGTIGWTLAGQGWTMASSAARPCPKRPRAGPRKPAPARAMSPIAPGCAA
jgi:rhodanese-related sulfurtransferase